MKKKIKRKNGNAPFDDLFDLCIEKGLIEKKEHGYHFRAEFFRLV